MQGLVYGMVVKRVNTKWGNIMPKLKPKIGAFLAKLNTVIAFLCLIVVVVYLYQKIIAL
jgi:hypothetical protein